MAEQTEQPLNRLDSNGGDASEVRLGKMRTLEPKPGICAGKDGRCHISTI